jgi:hypothetical protein
MPTHTHTHTRTHTRTHTHTHTHTHRQTQTQTQPQDASTASLVWVLTLMAEHPDVLERVRAEQVAARPDLDATITGETLAAMPYTRQVRALAGVCVCVCARLRVPRVLREQCVWCSCSDCRQHHRAGQSWPTMCPWCAFPCPRVAPVPHTPVCHTRARVNIHHVSNTPHAGGQGGAALPAACPHGASGGHEAVQAHGRLHGEKAGGKQRQAGR